jgi:hypothetical protein
MVADTRTISQIEAQRYDWIAAECCKGTVWVPFRMIRESHPRWPVSSMTVDEIGAKLRCDKCGCRPRLYYPARQEDAPGFARSF